MSIFERVQQAFESFFAAAARIFGPSDDQYPNTGTQPYEGDPYDERHQER